jgi:regulator of sirC expression with transglutaminase-like and TPR domain
VDSSIYHEFEQAVAGTDQDVDLFGAAMIISRLGGDPVDEHVCARKLDLIAEAVLEYAAGATDADSLAHAIDYQLFSVLGFHGNAANYTDPANSYLSEVIASRKGIPITLSLLYMEVAQRVGLRCDGIGYPQHFIVRCGDPESPIFVDPYHQGSRLDREELLAGLRSIDLGGASPESFLSAVTRRQLLQRMLNNLHLIFREQRAVDRWLDVIELQIRLEPWNAALVGERGMLHYRQGKPGLALADLERYVHASSRESTHAGALRLLNELRLRYGGSEEVR